MEESEDLPAIMRRMMPRGGGGSAGQGAAQPEASSQDAFFDALLDGATQADVLHVRQGVSHGGQGLPESMPRAVV